MTLLSYNMMHFTTQKGTKGKIKRPNECENSFDIYSEKTPSVMITLCWVAPGGLCILRMNKDETHSYLVKINSKFNSLNKPLTQECQTQFLQCLDATLIKHT